MEVRRFEGHHGVTLVADVGGDKADPAVILLHGTGSTRHSWARTARDLVAAGRYVIALDLRGHGDSGWSPVADYSLEAHLADVAAVMAGLETTPTLVGHLAGGWIALAAAGEPMRTGLNRANALILADVATRFGEEARRRTRTLMLSAPEGFASLYEAASALESRFPHEKRRQRLANVSRSLRHIRTDVGIGTMILRSSTRTIPNASPPLMASGSKRRPGQSGYPLYVSGVRWDSCSSPGTCCSSRL